MRDDTKPRGDRDGDPASDPGKRSDASDGSPGLGRRTFLAGAAASSAVGLPAFADVGRAADSFVIEQHGEQHQVTPLSYGDQSIEEFYGYRASGHSHSNTPTGIERADTSALFLYDGPNGLSLATIHDAPHTGTGGEMTVDFSGLPTASTVFADSFDDGDLSDWQTTTEGDADVTTDAGRLRLRVYRCSTAEAVRDLGEHSGTLEVSFDWRNEAEGWYEYTRWQLEDGDGNAIPYEVVSGTDLESPEEYDTKSGSVTVRADVDGTVRVRFWITPSRYCGNYNHYDTYLWIDNLELREGGGSWVIRDDDHDHDTYGTTSVYWKWNGNNTDGGAFRGGLDDGFEVTVDPTFTEGISEWQFLSGDASDPDRITLDVNSPVTVRSADAAGGPSLDAAIDEKLGLASHIDSQFGEYVDASAPAEAVLVPPDPERRYENAVGSGGFTRADALEAIDRMKMGEALTDMLFAGAMEGGETPDNRFGVPNRQPTFDSDVALAKETGEAAATGALLLEVVRSAWEKATSDGPLATVIDWAVDGFQYALDQLHSAFDGLVSFVSSPAETTGEIVDAAEQFVDDLFSGDFSSVTDATEAFLDYTTGPVRDSIRTRVLDEGFNDDAYKSCEGSDALKGPQEAVESFDGTFEVTDDGGPDLQGSFDTAANRVVHRRRNVKGIYVEQSEEVGGWYGDLPISSWMGRLLELVEDFLDESVRRLLSKLGRLVKMVGRMLTLAEAVNNYTDQLDAIDAIKAARLEHNVGLDEIATGSTVVRDCEGGS